MLSGELIQKSYSPFVDPIVSGNMCSFSKLAEALLKTRVLPVSLWRCTTLSDAQPPQYPISIHQNKVDINIISYILELEGE